MVVDIRKLSSLLIMSGQPWGSFLDYCLNSHIVGAHCWSTMIFGTSWQPLKLDGTEVGPMKKN